jgi:hypothetical protein
VSPRAKEQMTPTRSTLSGYLRRGRRLAIKFTSGIPTHVSMSRFLLLPRRICKYYRLGYWNAMNPIRRAKRRQDLIQGLQCDGDLKALQWSIRWSANSGIFRGASIQEHEG